MNEPYVNASYRHVQKLAKPHGRIVAGSSTLKWYEIAAPESEVPFEIGALAQNFLVSEAAKADWECGGQIGFSMLHRCGREFYFFIVCTWHNNNELWETIYFKPSDRVPVFAPFPETRHRGTYCVWEMGVVRHETEAWISYLRSARDAGAREHYLRTVWEGVVG